MQPENRQKKIWKNKSRMVWLTASLLTILVVASIAVAGTCLYSYTHQSDCQISLYDGDMATHTVAAGSSAAQKSGGSSVQSQAAQYRGKQAKQQAEKYAFQVKDSDQIWSTQTAVKLFQNSYKNKNGKVTVRSADSGQVIAPGTEGKYTFSLKNTGEKAADYKVWVEADVSTKLTGMPLQTRMSGADGWLLGSNKSWEKVSKLDGVSTQETIDAGKSAEYTIYWKWPFEQGTDENDTGMGNVNIKQGLSYTVTIHTLASESSKGGNGDSHNRKPASGVKRVKTGDTGQFRFWSVVLIASAGMLLILLFWKRKQEKMQTVAASFSQDSRKTGQTEYEKQRETDGR